MIGKKNVGLAVGLAVVMALTVVSMCAASCEKKGETAGKVPAAGIFEVVGTGKGEKKVLSYAAKVGERFSLTVTEQLVMDETADGQAVPSRRWPGIECVLDGEVKEVGAGGEMTLGLAVVSGKAADDRTLDSQMKSEFEAMVDRLKGVRISMVVTSSGEVKSFEMKGAEGLEGKGKQAAELIAQAVGLMAVRVPTEAVGMGAQWKLTRKVKLGGVDAVETLNCTLLGTGMMGSVIEVKSAVTAEEQVIDAAVGSLKLKVFSTKGSGEGKSSLQQGLPLLSSSSLSWKFEHEMKALLSDREMPMQRKVGMTSSGMGRTVRTPTK